jgi:hypothetical protein
MLTGAHQGQFHLVLDVFDVQSAARGKTPFESAGHLVCQMRHQFPDSRGGCSGATFHGEKRLGESQRDLVVRVRDHGAVPLDHPDLTRCGSCDRRCQWSQGFIAWCGAHAGAGLVFRIEIGVRFALHWWSSTPR